MVCQFKTTDKRLALWLADLEGWLAMRDTSRINKFNTNHYHSDKVSLQDVKFP
ncbi:hypothetical protein ADINL_1608 [Nitrincola lacisaponensis]|uniref:Uncharacterized protein n=1 Tax=Nitrincola lacisaponensis TaxID=267850 RepID=A0A063Y5F7_9GAMM|nr:hypothetical protein ADINL_1608 [Nitrincola lacisaponensis]